MLFGFGFLHKKDFIPCESFFCLVVFVGNSISILFVGLNNSSDESPSLKQLE